MTFVQKLRVAEVYLAKADKKLAPVIKSSGPCRLKPHKDHYGELVGSIVGQQLSAKAGSTIWRRVLALFNDKMPTPEQLLKIDGQKLRDAGCSWPKVGYMKDLAQHIIDGRLDLDHVSTMPNDQLIEQLTAVKGIGEWSAHMFMMFGLGRLDILPVGDLGIRKAIQKLYPIKNSLTSQGISNGTSKPVPLPTPEQIITIANKNKWHPYESVACWYLWQSLDNSPTKETRHTV